VLGLRGTLAATPLMRAGRVRYCVRAVQAHRNEAVPEHSIQRPAEAAAVLKAGTETTANMTTIEVLLRSEGMRCDSAAAAGG